jgi:hypothetical protein
MGLIEDELKIIRLENLLGLELSLPSYQRPYRWTVNSTNTLFQDIYEAYESGLEEYRIGSVILHKENQTYNIVDGQQRLTTLSILLHILGYEKLSLLDVTMNLALKEPVLRNHSVLSKRIHELGSSDIKDRFKDYLLKNCSIVQIVTDREQEAFQFFDSQNSRGKELAPHDLLKSYHLREMHEDSESQKIEIIKKWEDQNQEHLKDLFKNYLYPLTQWYKGRNGLGYSSDKIGSFKGIASGNRTNFAVYHKASNLYVEKFNSNGSNELIGARLLNQFQLTQNLVSGRRFFHYTLHYGKILERIQAKLNQYHKSEEIPKNGRGEIYTKQLYECVLLFFVDRFGWEYLEDSILQQFYTWSYSIRLVMSSVYPETINKYAIGDHDRVNYGLNLFSLISEMKDPSELKLVILEKPKIKEETYIKKYKTIIDRINSANGWDLK